MWNTLKFILWSCSLLFASFQLSAQAAADTTQEEVKPKVNYGHQLCLSFDAYQVLANSLLSYRTGYEFAADYYYKNELYWVLEGGWGSSNISYTDLSYTSKNDFFRAGFNKCLLERAGLTDWDMMFVGLRYGMAFVTRNPANYTVIDSLWGNNAGNVPGQSFNAYWVEITGGMRVELLKGFFAGYTIRGKFLMNPKTFQDLAPLYIAGYGRGDKTAVFDFNLYLSYSIRWKKPSLPAAKK